MDDALVLDVPAPEIEVSVGGKPLTASSARPCGHASFGSSVVTADVLNADGSLSHREARFRLRCMECGVPCEVETTGRVPADGAPGVVVRFRPLDEDNAVPSPVSPLGGPNAG